MATCMAPAAITTDPAPSEKATVGRLFLSGKPYLSDLHTVTPLLSDNQYVDLVLLCYIACQPVPAEPCRDDRAFSFAETAVATVDPSLVDMFGGASSPPTFLR